MVDKTVMARSAATLLALCFSVAANATEREHAAHEHGVGQLNIAIEGQEVEIELVSPGADIVGFEHEAESEGDKAAVERALSSLKDADALFAFPPAAQCQIEEAEVESAQLDDHDHHDEKHEHGEEEAEEEDHDHHGEKHEHGEEEAEEEDHDHHGEKHEHGEEEAEEEEHAEFHAHYHFECANPANLTHVDIKFFETFPSARELDVQAISPRGQSARELTPDAARLEF